MTFIHVVDIITFDISHVTRIIYLFMHIACNICQVTIYLHSAKRRIRKDPVKIVIHDCKLHVEA